MQGTTGTTGSTGSQGTTGTQGTTGSTGSQGTTGLQGIQGTQGLLGTQGLQGTTPTVVMQQWRKAAAGGETTLSGTDDFATSLSYVVGAEQVFINGVLLERGVDYTATTGTSITGLTALVAGDISTVISHNSFNIANAIQSTQISAKGDLIVGTGSGTYTNQGVGADGSTLVANSSASTGVSWAGNVVAGRNGALNAAFDNWQRGTSFTPTGATNQYTADRWQIYRGIGAATFSRQSAGLNGFTYNIRGQRNSSDANTNPLYLMYSMETADSLRYLGKSVTLSFWARAGANYSATSSLLNSSIVTGTSTDLNQLSWTGYSVVATQNFTLTTSWQRFSYTTTFGTGFTQTGFRWEFDPTGTAGANDYFEITGVQFEIGSVATSFQTATGTLQGELQACRRYLPAFTGQTDYIGYAYGTNTALWTIPFDVPARVVPTGITTSGTFNAFALNTLAGVTPSFNEASVNSGSVLAGFTITAGQGSRLQIASNALLLFTGCEL